MTKSLGHIHRSQLSTGFYHDGYCRMGADDMGAHVIAAIVTDEFLNFTKSRGNVLQTPRPEYRFPGLKSGDRWCLCASPWSKVQKAGVATPVNLSATHQKVFEIITLDTLKKYQKL